MLQCIDYFHQGGVILFVQESWKLDNSWFPSSWLVGCYAGNSALLELESNNYSIVLILKISIMVDLYDNLTTDHA